MRIFGTWIGSVIVFAITSTTASDNSMIYVVKPKLTVDGHNAALDSLSADLPSDTRFF